MGGNRVCALQIPSYFALILRAFSVIEGIALRVDPQYSIVQVSCRHFCICQVKLCGPGVEESLVQRNLACQMCLSETEGGPVWALLSSEILSSASACTTGVLPLHRAPAAVR